jgi:proteasome lid subunit RPN8/RPN11
MSRFPPLTSLRFVSDVGQVLVEEAAASSTEICGLLAGVLEGGVVGRITTRIAVPNRSSQPHSFLVCLSQMCEEREKIEHSGLMLLGFYHSHPGGNPEPSYRDLETPEILQLPSLIIAPGARTVLNVYGIYGREITILPPPS